MKQEILTVNFGEILTVLKECRRKGQRIVSVSTHYNVQTMLMGYLVIVEEARDDA